MCSHDTMFNPDFEWTKTKLNPLIFLRHYAHTVATSDNQKGQLFISIFRVFKQIFFIKTMTSNVICVAAPLQKCSEVQQKNAKSDDFLL